MLQSMQSGVHVQGDIPNQQHMAEEYGITPNQVFGAQNQGGGVYPMIHREACQFYLNKENYKQLLLKLDDMDSLGAELGGVSNALRTSRNVLQKYGRSLGIRALAYPNGAPEQIFHESVELSTLRSKSGGEVNALRLELDDMREAKEKAEKMLARAVGGGG